MSEETPKIEEKNDAPAPIAKNASWGVVISIIVIVLMILIGAFYSWGQRVAQQHPEAVQTH